MSEISQLDLNALDHLFQEVLAKEPLGYTPQDIDVIIEVQRQYRRRLDAGEKPRKELGPKKDLKELLQMKKPDLDGFRREF